MDLRLMAWMASKPKEVWEFKVKFWHWYMGHDGSAELVANILREISDRLSTPNFVTLRFMIADLEGEPRGNVFEKYPTPNYSVVREQAG